MGGDWNAEGGARQEGEVKGPVGTHGVGERNARGHWFVKWAWAEELVIANTGFRKSLGKMWSHI